MKILHDLDFELNNAEIGRRLGIGAESEEWQDVQRLVQELSGLIKVKAVYRPCYIREKTAEQVDIEDVTFKSKVLRKNLEEVQRVFPFVITLGEQVEERLTSEKDFLERYYLDTIANVALQGALQSLCTFLENAYQVRQLSYMNPGSLQDWPIDQQLPLFDLLGDVQEAIGVNLGANMLMYPSKTESGIFFPTEVTFFSCQLCPNKECPSRKAAFDAKLAREYAVLDAE